MEKQSGHMTLAIRLTAVGRGRSVIWTPPRMSTHGDDPMPNNNYQVTHISSDLDSHQSEWKFPPYQPSGRFGFLHLVRFEYTYCTM